MRALKILFLLLVTSMLVQAQDNFVKVQDGHFVINGEPYFYLGANFWFGMHLGANNAYGDRERLVRELDALKELGATNLRIMVDADGPADAPYRVQPALQYAPKKYDETLLEGVDFLLAEMGKRDMKAVICLNNFFHWSGGMAQYVNWATGEPIPYPHLPPYDWDAFQEYSALFFANKKAKRWFKKFLREVIKRENTITGMAYLADPTIMAWQLANEPRGLSQKNHYLKWVEKTAAYIKKLDNNHLVSLGGEGFFTNEATGTAFDQVSKIDHLDYLTMHLWVENWFWFNPKEPTTYPEALKNAITYMDRHLAVGQETSKPLVLEEFGMARDGGDFKPTGTTQMRDLYYQMLFDYLYRHATQGDAIHGANFWSWSGEGIPPRPEEMWKLGDPLTGDPPHESQGWYGIYNSDTSTLALIKKYALLMADIKMKQ